MGRNRLHRNGHTQLRRIVQHGVHAAAQDIISRRALLLRPGKKRRLGADAARPQLRRTAQPQAERIQLRLARSLIGQRRLDIAPQHGDINVVFPESRADLAQQAVRHLRIALHPGNGLWDGQLRRLDALGRHFFRQPHRRQAPEIMRADTDLHDISSFGCSAPA